jgi:hypothetical protein
MTAFAAAFVLLAALGAHAQPAVRKDDQFWKRRLVNRLVLVEKINRPLVAHASNIYEADERFAFRNGLVGTLLEGVKAGNYAAYDPENWSRALSYEELLSRMRENDEALTGPQEEELDPDLLPDPFAAEASSEDEWEWEEVPSAGASVAQTQSPAAPVLYTPDLAPYEEVIHIVEDWIFDKNRSMMVQQIQYFEVIWVDPTGSLPEKVLARFKWSEVQEQLDRTMCYNRFNDAEQRSIAETLELRLFHSFIINVSGTPLRSIAEAEMRRQELVEFEHHLWSY